MTLFDFVKAQLPILDIISEKVQLKPMGSYFKGCCPFHSEKDASFTVSPDRQIFYCFGCQATGDVIAFFARIENVSQIEAAKLLIEHYSLDVPQEIQKTSSKEFGNVEKKDLHHTICHEMALWTYQQLRKSKRAQHYFSDRGIQQATIDKFELGYFPGGSLYIDNFIKEMGHQGVLLKNLLDLGIIIEGRDHFFSPWEERIIFPIKDTLGKFCGFGGRVFQPQDDRAKYINSKEADWFIKGKLLFGFDIAKKTIQKKDAVFLVEGYMDCVVMAQYGYENTVATLGTACTLEHLKLAARQAATIYLLYDGDKAGQAALLRVAQLCWQINADLKVIKLPNDHDPASFLTAGLDLAGPISQGKDLFNAFIDQVSEGFLDKPISKKLIAAEKMIEVIIGVQDNFKQELLLHQAAQTMQIPFDALKKLLINLRKKKALKKNDGLFSRHDQQESEQSQAQNVPEKSLHGQEKDEISLLEEKIFSVILNGLNSKDTLKIDDWVIPYLSSKLQPLISTLHTVAQRADMLDGKRYTSFFDSLDQDQRALALKMSLRFDQGGSKELLDDLMSQFFRNHWKRMVREIKDQIKKAEEGNDADTVKILFGKVTELKQRMLNRGLM